MGAVILLLVLVYFYHTLGVIWNHPRDLQWDFKIYYYAGKAYDQGLDPYVRDNLVQASGKKFWLHFVYPPLTLAFLKFLPKVDFETGCKIWLILKVLSLAALVFVWKRFFLRNTSLLLMIPITLFAFDAAVFTDFKAGNISVFEQLFVWSALVALLKNRKMPFVLLILACSMFKISLATFMFLLIALESPQKWRWLAAGLSCVAVIAAANYFLMPQLFHSFMSNLQFLGERAENLNFSMLAFWEDFFTSIGFIKRLEIDMYLAYIGYALTSIAVAFISIQSYIRFRNRGDKNNIVFTILFFCCTYALIMPRLKNYSYILLIPALLYLFSYIKTQRFVYLLIPLVLIPVSTPLLESRTVDQFFLYYPLFLVFVIWLYFNSACNETAGMKIAADSTVETRGFAGDPPDGD